MKHLKYIYEMNQHSLSDEVTTTLLEILQELRDEKFNIAMSGHDIITIMKFNYNFDAFSNEREKLSMCNPFTYDEVSETIERIKDYMQLEGYSTKVRNFYKNSLDCSFLSDDLPKIKLKERIKKRFQREYIYQINISFKKI